MVTIYCAYALGDDVANTARDLSRRNDFRLNSAVHLMSDGSAYLCDHLLEEERGPDRMIFFDHKKVWSRKEGRGIPPELIHEVATRQSLFYEDRSFMEEVKAAIESGSNNHDFRELR